MSALDHYLTTIQVGQSVIDNPKLDFLIQKLDEVKNLTGSVIEVGVFQAGSAKRIVENTDKDIEIYLCDTFTGIPFKSIHDNVFEIGHFKESNYEAIKTLFQDNKNVNILKGIFPEDTAKYIKDNTKFKFVHLDVDQYQSYHNCLDYFYPRMISQGIIVFDDYGESNCHGATKAVDEFFKDKEPIITINNTSYIVKS